MNSGIVSDGSPWSQNQARSQSSPQGPWFMGQGRAGRAAFTCSSGEALAMLSAA
jgi:hypothetical protein